MTIDDLINEGKTFKIKYVEAHLEPAGYGILAKIPGCYYLAAGSNENFSKNLKDVSGNTKEEITTNVFSKFKTFGLATLSNILANIVTNPTIWGQL